MRTRRSARQTALQAIYQCDTLGDWSDPSIELFFEHFTKVLNEGDITEQSMDSPTEKAMAEDDDYARQLIQGVRQNLSEIDETLNSASTHWSVPRMARVERAILRLATFELLFMPGVPVAAVINEAIEIAKRFSGGEAPHFVNGVLDTVASRRRDKAV
jgi:N utilization substance protein B